MKKLLLFITAVALTFLAFGSKTIYVKWDAAGANNGISWTDAYISFQSALNAAVSGDQVWVAKGTYKPSFDYGLGGGSRNYHFRMIQGVAIYGGFAGTETQLSQRNWSTNVTIMSGDLNGDDVITGSGQTLSIINMSENCYCVFYHPAGLGLTGTAVLDGFKITGGSFNSNYSMVGGIVNYSASPSITNCIVTGNSYLGICNTSSLLANPSAPAITNCMISQNAGLGIWNSGYAWPTIINCTISGNGGSGIRNDWNAQSPTTVINCLICANYSGYRQSGGGIYNYRCVINLINCTISGNLSDTFGGGIFESQNVTTILDNVVIWGNTATQNGNQVAMFAGNMTLNHSCYQNGTNDIYIQPGTFTATNNNITIDPVFANAAAGNYILHGISPCIDVGNDSYNCLTTDIRGNGYARKLLKTNCAQAGTIDMGAYEYNACIDPPQPPSIPTLSHWGLILLGLVLLGFGSLYILKS
jgi:parallel beta-helix repeat protein